MRILVALSLGFGFGFASGGCQLLPHQDIPCNETTLCEQFGGPGGGKVPAAFVLGQPDDHTTWYSSGFNSPTAVVLTPTGQLLVADKNTDRVLLWNSIPQQGNQAADLSFGTVDPATAPPGDQSLDYKKRTPSPIRLTTDGTRLALVSEWYDYMIVWKSFPTQNLGGYSFVYENMQLAADADNWNVGSPLLAASRIYLADKMNSRVLIWNPQPDSSTAPATTVLGQTGLGGSMVNAGMSSPGPATLKNPDGSPSTDGTRLFVTDTGNNRLLIWNSLPTAAAAPADLVVGQADFASGAPNRGLATPGLSSLKLPQGSAASMDRLVVADTGNNRVLLWNSIPTSVDTPASFVLGQTGATGAGSNLPTLTGSTMDSPQSVATDGKHVVVADTDNNRVLIWNDFPGGNGKPADVILGQTSPTARAVRGVTASAARYGQPIGLTLAGDKFVVTDRDAHRVLIYPGVPVSSSALPTLVLGQSSFTGQLPMTVAANQLFYPMGASSDGTALAVADTGNHRILIWKTLPTQNQQAADIVLGQATMITAKSGGGPNGMTSPNSVFLSGGRVYVADTNNHRVLIWRTLPAQGQPPDIVLGQPDLNGVTQYHGLGKAAADTLRSPSTVYADDKSIYVSDSGSNRILIWHTLDPKNGQGADVVLGQNTFDVDAGPNGANETAFEYPVGLAVQSGRLYAADSALSRVVYWNTVPTTNNKAFDGILGQPNVNSSDRNAGGISVNTLSGPTGLLVTSGGIYIADSSNHRVVGLPPVAN